jgi:Zn-finger nucleic acid-binding protein
MPIIVTCPSCQTKLKVAEPTVGKQISCPNCTFGFVAKEELAPVELVQATPPPLPRRSMPPEEDERSPRDFRRDDEEDHDDLDERPRRKKKYAGPGFLARSAAALGTCGIVCLILGGILFFIGWQKKTLAGLGLATPQDIRVADLAAKGPGNNIHVRVTDLEFGLNYVFEEKNKRWTTVWIPLFPTGADLKGQPKVLLKTYKASGPPEVDQMAMRKQVQGVITNSIHSLGSKELAELRKSYPGADFNNVYILEDGETIPSSGTVLAFLLAGGMVLVLGVLLAVGWIMGKMQR